MDTRADPVITITGPFIEPFRCRNVYANAVIYIRAPDDGTADGNRLAVDTKPDADADTAADGHARDPRP